MTKRRLAYYGECGFGGFTWVAYGRRYPYQLDKEDLETAMSDFLCDLMHYCDSKEIDFDDALSAATRHYEVEETYDWDEEVGLDPRPKPRKRREATK